MSMFMSLAALDAGQVFHSIVDSLPTDPVSLFTLGLCAVAIAAVFYGGRNKDQGAGKGGAA